MAGTDCDGWRPVHIVQSMEEPSDIVTLRQLVEARPFLSERWIRSLLSSGDLSAYSRLGGRLLFRLTDVDAVVEGARPRR